MFFYQQFYVSEFLSNCGGKFFGDIFSRGPGKAKSLIYNEAIGFNHLDHFHGVFFTTWRLPRKIWQCLSQEKFPQTIEREQQHVNGGDYQNLSISYHQLLGHNTWMTRTESADRRRTCTIFVLLHSLVLSLVDLRFETASSLRSTSLFL